MRLRWAFFVAVSWAAAVGCSVDDDLRCDLAGGVVKCAEGLVCDEGSGRCVPGPTFDGGPTCGSCTDFPASVCTADGLTVKSYQEPGACRGGVCDYAPTESACAHGCASGACVGCTPDCTGRQCGGDGCGGTCGGACASPPAPTCVNATTLRTRAAVGQCSDGHCAYLATDTPCAHGCANGACQGCTRNCTGRECGDDGCGGSCGSCSTTPPSATCPTATTLTTYTATGSCVTGVCSFTSTTSVCPAPAHATAKCATGSCGFTCDPSFQPQGGQCVAAAPSCSTGDIPVPASTLPDGTVVPGFCVMKYEAKGSGSPVSTASGTPRVGLSWTAARTACQSVGKHLIAENEWLALANDVVHVASNWTGGSVGAGAVYSGHNDSSPGNALAASTSDGSGYSGTGNSSGNQRRTLTLSNGQVIWDLAGNVWEWVDETIAVGSRYHGGASRVMDYNSASADAHPIASNVPLAKRPPNGWNADQGMGRYFDGQDAACAQNDSGCDTQAAFLRGGYWLNTATAGVFALYLGSGRANSTTSFGFRCAGP